MDDRRWLRADQASRTTPIPAGFFCENSQPFTGKVKFKGAPLTVEPAGSLGAIDTVVRRLDDAKFNAKGEATTRIQLMALSLVSTKPIETSCGKYDVAVSLDGQAADRRLMQIFQSDAFGGTYYGAAGAQRQGRLHAGQRRPERPARGDPPHRPRAGHNSVWAYVNLPRYKQGVRVDTNGDGRPDTALPASSNFLAGVAPAVLKSAPAAAPPGRDEAQARRRRPAISCPVGQCPYQLLPLRAGAGHRPAVEPVGHRLRRRTTSTASGPAPRPGRSPASERPETTPARPSPSN